MVRYGHCPVSRRPGAGAGDSSSSEASGIPASTEVVGSVGSAVAPGAANGVGSAVGDASAAGGPAMGADPSISDAATARAVPRGARPVVRREVMVFTTDHASRRG